MPEFHVTVNRWQSAEGCAPIRQVLGDASVRAGVAGAQPMNGQREPTAITRAPYRQEQGSRGRSPCEGRARVSPPRIRPRLDRQELYGAAKESGPLTLGDWLVALRDVWAVASTS
jgi:hypothetical protein